jgi:hypothetical protein
MKSQVLSLQYVCDASAFFLRFAHALAVSFPRFLS